MRKRNATREQEAFITLKQKKVFTLKELALLLRRSPTTVRRRLKEWRALTSYNKNGRYHTLPSIPAFSKRGLWEYRGIFFSKYGTLKNTIIHFVRRSGKGLSNSELTEIIGINPHSFMPQFKDLKEIKKEKHGRRLIYYSSEDEIFRAQKEKRFPPIPSTIALPTDVVSIAILVERILNPNSSISELALILSAKGHDAEQKMIRGLFQHHGLLKKTPAT